MQDKYKCWQESWNKQASRYKRISGSRGKEFYEKTIPLIKNHIKEGSLVVDLGCGSGNLSIAVSDKASFVTSIDFSGEMIEQAKEKQQKAQHRNIKFYTGDIHYTNIDEDYADVVILSNVIQCTNSPESLLDEAKRIAKRDALIITITDCYKSIRSFRGLLKGSRLFFSRTFRLIPWMKFFSFRRLSELIENNGMVIIHEEEIRHGGISSLFAILKT